MYPHWGDNSDKKYPIIGKESYFLDEITNYIGLQLVVSVINLLKGFHCIS